MSIVPNMSEFCNVLKIIKHWAKSMYLLNHTHSLSFFLLPLTLSSERGIYSTKFGFLGGAAWTILVAYICQKFPFFSEENLILEFFKTFCRWDWSIPVALDGVNAKKFISVLHLDHYHLLFSLTYFSLSL